MSTETGAKILYSTESFDFHPQCSVGYTYYYVYRWSLLVVNNFVGLLFVLLNPCMKTLLCG